MNTYLFSFKNASILNMFPRESFLNSVTFYKESDLAFSFVNKPQKNEFFEYLLHNC